jgi:leucyl aminopeptidase
MEFHSVARLDKRKSADALVIPMWQGKKGPDFAVECGSIQSQVSLPIQLGDFKGKEGESLTLYLTAEPEKRVILLGLGEPDKMTTEQLRRIYSALVKGTMSKKVTSLNIMIPDITFLSEENLVRGISEGMLLTNYFFDKHKKEVNKALLEKVTFIDHGKKVLDIANKALLICQGVYLARDLVNENADIITPEYLAECAKEISKEQGSIKTTVLTKKQIEKEKMGLLLAVNRGSAHDPAFIIMSYKGNPKSADHTVYVGKGITYDTGGLNIKTSGMETMKCDMAGAAVGLATILTAARLKLKVNLTVVVPATENGIDATSYKVGDVYPSYLGKTVEITNTDAEGRLVLADALAYACKKLEPTRLIDMATLTGGIDIALGVETTGVMSNDDALSDALIHAGSETFERIWRLPIYEEYKDAMKSDIADLKNSSGRSASSIRGAMFLKEFVDDKIPWAHFDIASTAFLSEPLRYHPKHATGVGVRLMIDFLEHL